MRGLSLGIAVPSYEQADYARDAIRSLRELTIPFEAIVQDGGSSDRTLRAIRSAIGDDDRIRFEVEPDAGQSDAINRAWRKLLSDHDFVTWFNTDDLIRPAGVAALVEHLATHPGTVVAYGDLDAIDEEGRMVGWARYPSRVRRYRLVYHNNIVPGIVPVIRSSALEEVGLLNADLHYVMDHELFCRLASVGELRRVPVTVAAYRTHDEAKTWGNKRASEREAQAAMERYRGLPRPVARVLGLALKAAWWPTRRAYTRGVMRRSSRQFRS